MSQNPSSHTVILADYAAVGIAKGSQLSPFLSKYERVFTPDMMPSISDEMLISKFGDQFEELLGQDSVEAREKRRQLIAVHNALSSIGKTKSVTIMGLDDDVIEAVNGIDDEAIQEQLGHFKMYGHSPDRKLLKTGTRKDMVQGLVDDGHLSTTSHVYKIPKSSDIPGLGKDSAIRDLGKLEGYYETAHKDICDEILYDKFERHSGVENPLFKYGPKWMTYLSDPQNAKLVMTGKQSPTANFNLWAKTQDDIEPVESVEDRQRREHDEWLQSQMGVSLDVAQKRRKDDIVPKKKRSGLGRFFGM